MGDGRLARLLYNFEGVTYWALAAPILSCLPAAVGYRVACWRGDWLFRRQAIKSAELARNLRRVLGNELTPAYLEQVARDWFRFGSCEALDVMRMRRRARPLRRLVEIRGREHLEAALAAGKGAILCGAHFGSFDSGFTMLGGSGFRVTTIGRWQHNYTVGLSSAERRFWDLVYARPLRRHRHRPNIEPWPGRFEVAALAATALRANEVVTICVDVPPLDADRPRTIEVPFLRGRAKLLPGVVTLAQITGAPVHTCLLYRTADYRHQVLEISEPVPMEGDPVTAFGRCATILSSAISRNPAHWAYWASTADLVNLGLIPADLDTPPAAIAMPGPGAESPNLEQAQPVRGGSRASSRSPHLQGRRESRHELECRAPCR
jgi:KDO2-lipid IV(A) lauroyltransferase